MRLLLNLFKLRIGVAIALAAVAGLAVTPGAMAGWKVVVLTLAVLFSSAAAGAFNQQQNLMTLAVATDSVLAEANSGLIQAAVFNGVEQQDSINSVGSITIANASGIG